MTSSRYGWVLNLIAGTLVAILAAADPVQAQPGRGGFGRGGFGGGGFGGGGIGDALSREDVQKEIGLSEEQRQQISSLQTTLRDDPEFQTLMQRMQETPQEERMQLFGEIRSLSERRINGLLNPEQQKRLRELTFQRDGMRSLQSPGAAQQFGLSEEQQEQVTAATQEYDRARFEIRFNRELSEEERNQRSEELRTQFETKVRGVLTPQQTQAFEQQKGKAFEFAQDSGRGGPSPAAPVSAAPVAVPVQRPTAAAAFGAPAPEGVAPTLSFGTSPAGERTEPVKELTFNFRYAPWEDVLRLFAEAAGLTLDLNVVPPGTFNYLDNRKFTPAQALDVINGYLLQKGYILVQRDEFLVVLNLDNPIPPNLVPTVPVSDLPSRGRNELLTIIIAVEGMTAEDAAAEAQALMGPQGKAVALAKANRVVLTDIGSNLQRVHALLTGLTVPTGDKVFKQFKLRHIAVIEADMILRDLLGLQPRGVQNVSAGTGRDSSRGGFSGFGGFDPRQFSSRSSSSTPAPATRSGTTSDSELRVQIAIDERTNALLVTASQDDMRIVEEAILTLDVPLVEGEFSRSAREPYLEVYQLESSDALEVTKTLDVLFPGTVINEDGRARRIHVKATPDQHREIAAMIRRLDGAGGGIELAVIPLGRLDSYTATASIQQLFLADGNSAPIVQPHPTGNGLLVRGTTEQVSQIRLLLTQLEPGNGIGGGRVRTIPLGGRDPSEFLEALEEAWNASGRTPIRARVPSSPGTVRDRRIPALEPQAPEVAPGDRSGSQRPAGDNPAGEEPSGDRRRPEPVTPPVEHQKSRPARGSRVTKRTVRTTCLKRSWGACWISLKPTFRSLRTVPPSRPVRSPTARSQSRSVAAIWSLPLRIPKLWTIWKT